MKIEVTPMPEDRPTETVRVDTAVQPTIASLSLAPTVKWLFNVTCNYISVIYVTAHRYAGPLKNLNLRSGSQCHRHFVRYFDVPVQAPTRGHPFYTIIPRNHPRLRHAGDTEDTFST